MSSAPELVGDDRVAAELVLRLLDGAETEAARQRLGDDAAFAALAAEWEERLAPLLDSVPAESPPAQLWDRIAAQIEPASEGGATIHQLRRKANLWRAYSAGITALAAALLVVIGLDAARRDPVVRAPPAGAQPAPMLVASLDADQGPAALIITYDPRSRSLIATPAVLQGAAGHDHELWLVPAAGTPRSLGIVTAGRPRRISVRPEMLNVLGADSTLAISVEPQGGSPTGQPTGPVIAKGQLSTI
jgi:anti-sigma-K factor RskA